MTQTFEPGATQPGLQIRQLLLGGGPLAPMAEVMLFAADRAHHVETVVRPALARGEVVLTDRYIGSSIAYQDAGLGIGGVVKEISMTATGGLLPDLTVLLDVDVETGLRRAKSRLSLDAIESRQLDFHERVRDSFLKQADEEPRRHVVVDARRTLEEIADEVSRAVDKLLEKSAPPDAVALTQVVE